MSPDAMRVDVFDTTLRDSSQREDVSLIDSTDGETTWSTIGASENLIEASWQALSDSVVHGLLRAPRAADSADGPA